MSLWIEADQIYTCKQTRSTGTSKSSSSSSSSAETTDRLSWSALVSTTHKWPPKESSCMIANDCWNMDQLSRLVISTTNTNKSIRGRWEEAFGAGNGNFSANLTLKIVCSGVDVGVTSASASSSFPLVGPPMIWNASATQNNNTILLTDCTECSVQRMLHDVKPNGQGSTTLS